MLRRRAKPGLRVGLDSVLGELKPVESRHVMPAVLRKRRWWEGENGGRWNEREGRGEPAGLTADLVLCEKASDYVGSVEVLGIGICSIPWSWESAIMVQMTAKDMVILLWLQWPPSSSFVACVVAGLARRNRVDLEGNEDSRRWSNTEDKDRVKEQELGFALDYSKTKTGNRLATVSVLYTRGANPEPSHGPSRTDHPMRWQQHVIVLTLGTGYDVIITVTVTVTSHGHESRVTSHESRVTSHKSQVTSHKSQVTSHKSQVERHGMIMTGGLKWGLHAVL
ncbi:hypothetical protein EDB86DRAFT_2828744 [Lactarius hatsudake]|nr:hypothetical protein EDB86DRAFT_2828744 [Lactarius hatsudake]